MTHFWSFLALFWVKSDHHLVGSRSRSARNPAAELQYGFRMWDPRSTQGPEWGRVRAGVGQGEPWLYLIGHWDPPQKSDLFVGPLGPRRAGPLDRRRFHTSIGVGPGPAGVSLGYILGARGFVHLVPKRAPPGRNPMVGTGLTLALHRYRGRAESSRRPGMSPRTTGGGGGGGGGAIRD